MTKKLKKAFDEISKLSDDEQDSVATWLLEELASEQRWQQAFSSSQDQLAALADAALAEHRQGRTQKLNPDKL